MDNYHYYSCFLKIAVAAILLLRKLLLLLWILSLDLTYGSLSLDRYPDLKWIYIGFISTSLESNAVHIWIYFQPMDIIWDRAGWLSSGLESNRKLQCAPDIAGSPSRLFLQWIVNNIFTLAFRSHNLFLRYAFLGIKVACETPVL